MIYFGKKNHYRGHVITEIPDMVSRAFEIKKAKSKEESPRELYELKQGGVGKDSYECLLIPLISRIETIALIPSQSW